MGGDNDFNVQAMITPLMWTIWTSLSAVRERPLNLITHSLTCIMLWVCSYWETSVRPSEAWNTLFWPVHGSVDQPWLFYGMSVRPERFPGICRRTHLGNSLKLYMLMYLDHIQNWLVYGHDLLIFLILALFWLCETGQIWGFRAFPGERTEEMTWNFAHWCILTTFRTD